MSTIFILNGPNLNRLGRREPQIYGAATLDDIRSGCQREAVQLGVTVDFRQTNFEGELVQAIHEACEVQDNDARGRAAGQAGGAGIIINPAGYTFTSVAVMDALKMFDGPKIELHISNVHRREAVYHHSLMSPVVTAVMAGFGARGYRLALHAIADMCRDNGQGAGQ